MPGKERYTNLYTVCNVPEGGWFRVNSIRQHGDTFRIEVDVFGASQTGLSTDEPVSCHTLQVEQFSYVG